MKTILRILFSTPAFIWLLLISACGEEHSGPPPAQKQTFLDTTSSIRSEAQDAKYDAFREMCAPFLEMQAEIRPLEAMIAARTASPEDIARWQELSEGIRSERQELNAYVWSNEVTGRDRTVMRWIMQGQP